MNITDQEIDILINGYGVPGYGIETLDYCPEKFKNPKLNKCVNGYNPDFVWINLDKLSIQDKIELIEILRKYKAEKDEENRIYWENIERNKRKIKVPSREEIGEYLIQSVKERMTE